MLTIQQTTEDKKSAETTTFYTEELILWCRDGQNYYI